MPKINIPATTAMETLKPDGRIIALNSGANVIMPNMTEDEFKSKYNIYRIRKNSIHLRNFSISIYYFQGYHNNCLQTVNN